MAAGARGKASCAKASNPYHECTQACLQLQATPNKNNKTRAAGGGGGYGHQEKRRGGGAKQQGGGCPKASNPYHNCDDHNNNNNRNYKTLGGITPPLKNESKRQQKAEEEEEEEVLESSAPGVVDPSADDDAALHTSDHIIPNLLDPHSAGGDNNNREILLQDSREESSPSSPSSSSSSRIIAVGGYNVKESFGGILRSILHKYGDIGATCKLESLVMRSYYIQCVCFVVNELQHSSSSSSLKLKELSAVVKDVESAGLRVAWLRGVLDELLADADHIIVTTEAESLREQLHSHLQTLAHKEQELADIKTRIIPNIRDRLTHLHLKSSQIDGTTTALHNYNLHIKSLIDQLLL